MNYNAILGDAVSISDNTIHVGVWYPRSEDRPEFVEVELVDVRAADAVRISYDFDRDGWKIEQASRGNVSNDGFDQDPDWQEVSFVKAWARNPEHKT